MAKTTPIATNHHKSVSVPQINSGSISAKPIRSGGLSTVNTCSAQSFSNSILVNKAILRNSAHPRS